MSSQTIDIAPKEIGTFEPEPEYENKFSFSRISPMSIPNFVRCTVANGKVTELFFDYVGGEKVGGSITLMGEDFEVEIIPGRHSQKIISIRFKPPQFVGKIDELSAMLLAEAEKLKTGSQRFSLLYVGSLLKSLPDELRRVAKNKA